MESTTENNYWIPESFRIRPLKWGMYRNNTDKSVNSEINLHNPESSPSNHSNSTAFVLIFLEDITHEIYLRQLEELNRYKMKMLSSISHELKTPLNCSMGMLEELTQYIASDYYG